jgi:tRNA(Ile)-lysidine synthase
MPGIADSEFAALMAPLGSFGPGPRLAVAVSGGADSLTLALLADAWARARGGSVLALVVDHRLRPESSREAAEAVERLAARGIAARILAVAGLALGPGLAERARGARYAALIETCRAEGILHLLLGHHAADQAETVIMRALAGSGNAGLAAIAPVVETTFVRLVRPLLSVPPIRLRETLESLGIGWAEDPSNVDMRALRPRLRTLRADREGIGAATAALVAAAIAAGRERSRQEAAARSALASAVVLRGEGVALLFATPLPAEALSRLIQAVSGAEFPPNPATVAALAAAPRPATVAGVRLLPGGRFGSGLLLVREEAALQAEVPAVPGAVWDRRFRLAQHATPPAGSTLGPLGADAARFRRWSQLPAAALRTVPALRCGGTLIAVPHLGYPSPEICAHVPVLFSPPRPAAAAFFAL